MRQAAILALLVGLWAAGAPAASAQLPDVEVPDVEDTTEQLPDAPELPLPDTDPPPAPEAPSLPGGGSGSGGGGSGSGGTTPSLGDTSGGGSSSGGTSSGGSGSGSDGSGSGSGGSGDSGSGGGAGGAGGGSGDVCPCASPATGNPVAGDYDKCPLDRDGAGDTGSGRDAATLAADRESREEGGVSAGGVLGDGETDSEPDGEAAPPTRGDDGALGGTGLLPLAILVLGLGLLTVGLAVGAGRLVGARRDGPR